MSYAVSMIRGGRLAAPLRPVARRQTYRNVLYLIASFPLGVGYFLFLATGLTLGALLLVVLIGAPILRLMLGAWWRLGAWERELAIWWLGVEIPPMLRPRVQGPGPLRWARAYLGSQTTWTGLAYLLLKLPLGAVGFALATGAIALTALLVVWPLMYALGIAGGDAVTLYGLATALAAPPLGIAVGVGSLHLMNGAALLSGHFTRLMLGSSETARRLVESEALAEREHTRAERAEQSRRELIVNASHELRTPVASIRGHVESLLLEMEGRGPEAPAPTELPRHLGIVHRETERLGALVDDLLALARADADELRLELAPVDVGETAREVCETLAPLARRERQVKLVQSAEPGLPLALADGQRLSQVLLNLARNAIMHTPPGGIVSLSAERSGADRVAITVADTGAGIAPQDLERVFERFYRTDESRARASGGFGLGLAIVRDLVTAMGGSVSAESVVGKGSSFHVQLRTAPGDLGGAEPAAAGEAPAG
jgi:signal transduction histidine kinase